MWTKEKQSAYNAAYSAAHKDKKKATDAARYLAHKEEIKARNAAYLAAHRKEANAHNATYYAAHRDKKKAYQAAYRAAHKANRKEAGGMNIPYTNVFKTITAQIIKPLEIVWRNEYRMTVKDGICTIEGGAGRKKRIPLRVFIHFATRLMWEMARGYMGDAGQEDE